MHKPAHLPLALVAIGTALVLAAPSAHATATATASIGVVTWTLIDLDLGDAVVPSFTTTYPYSYSSATAPTASGTYQSLAGSYMPTSASSTSAYGSAAASTFSTGGQATSQIIGSVVAGSQIYSSASAEPLSVNFTLSPHTLLIVSTQASLAATTTVGYSGGNYESAYAAAYLYIYDSAYTAQYQATRSTGVSYNYDYTSNTYSGASSTNDGALQLYFANQTAAPLTGYLYGYAYAQGYSGIAAVPENNPLTLMAAGLAAIGLVLRRRQSAG